MPNKQATATQRLFLLNLLLLLIQAVLFLHKYTLCYRGIFLSDDKTKKYYARMNGETGEIFYTAEFELIDGTWQLIQEQS